jgi:hypothetical protein
MKISVSRGDPLKPNDHVDKWQVLDPETISQLSEIITTFVWSPIIWNGYRDGFHFAECPSFCVIDCDGGITLEYAKSLIMQSGLGAIFAPTRNHRKIKNGEKLPCDRFRIILNLDRKISDIKEYEYNIKNIIKPFKADPKATDGGRFFFPSVNIDETFRGKSLRVKKINLKLIQTKKETFTGKPGDIPLLVKAFINGRWLPKVGARSDDLYRLCLDMRRAGFNEDEMFHTILNSKIERIDFPDIEIRRIIKSALKRKSFEVEV